LKNGIVKKDIRNGADENGVVAPCGTHGADPLVERPRMDLRDDREN
jgi:hypothetical protein